MDLGLRFNDDGFASKCPRRILWPGGYGWAQSVRHVQDAFVPIQNCNAALVCCPGRRAGLVSGADKLVHNRNKLLLKKLAHYALFPPRLLRHCLSPLGFVGRLGTFVSPTEDVSFLENSPLGLFSPCSRKRLEKFRYVTLQPGL